MADPHFAGIQRRSCNNALQFSSRGLASEDCCGWRRCASHHPYKTLVRFERTPLFSPIVRFTRSLPVRRCGRVQLSFVTVTFNICCRSRWAQYTEVSISKVRLASEAGLDLRRRLCEAFSKAAPTLFSTRLALASGSVQVEFSSTSWLKRVVGVSASST